MAPPDIARATNHSLTAVDRYIRDYERVEVLLYKGLTPGEIGHAIGRGKRTVSEYRDIVLEFHADLVRANEGCGYVDNSPQAPTCPHIHSLYDDYDASPSATGSIS